MDGLVFRGAKRDLEEMAGNLMDNGCKWTATSLQIRSFVDPQDETSFIIAVSDDGPGMAADQYTEALKRGARLDRGDYNMSIKDPIHLENREQIGARLFSPTAGRNKAPIGEVITHYIPRGGRVLEIASGSGEHGAHMCALRPDITWQPTDPNAQSRESQDDWAKDCGGRFKPSLSLDTMQPECRYDATRMVGRTARL